jgi:hypothetical protein
VLDEIRNWSAKHLRKLENYTNALALNPLDNNETIHGLKTPQDKLEKDHQRKHYSDNLVNNKRVYQLCHCAKLIHEPKFAERTHLSQTLQIRTINLDYRSSE